MNTLLLDEAAELIVWDNGPKGTHLVTGRPYPTLREALRAARELGSDKGSIYFRTRSGALLAPARAPAV